MAGLLSQAKGDTVTTLTEPQETAFDAAVYDLPIPKLDGHKADKLVVSFSGQLDLDRTSAEDLEFIETLELGREVSLSVVATVTKKGFSLTAGKDEAPDQTGYGVGLRVQSVEVA